jgi:hypothetical protein
MSAAALAFSSGRSSLLETMKLHRFVLLSAGLAFASCDRDGRIGPCVHRYLEAVLHIESLRDRAANQAITEFRILKVLRDGQRQSPRFLASDPAYNVVAFDTTFVCNAPCGFGVESGSYELTLSATGYRDTVVSVHATYSKSGDGCPSFSDGGTRVSFVLQPM